MKRSSICIFVFAAAGISGANTYVGPRIPNSSCSSSPNLVVTVLSSTEVAKGVRVDIYREVENGERMAWTGVTASGGTVSPPALSPGIYRVAADAGDRSGEMSLLVGHFEGTTRCDLKVGLPYGTETETKLAQPSEVQLKDFRGVVVDEKGILIPHVIVRILRNGSAEGYLAQSQSDDKGKFEFHVDAGSYSAIFSTRDTELACSKLMWVVGGRDAS